MKCKHRPCQKTYPEHRWGKIRAAEEGWFISRDGVPWCPEHKPPWVDDWRAKKAAVKHPVVIEAETLAQIELDAIEVLKDWARRDFVTKDSWFEIVKVASSNTKSCWRGFYKLQNSDADISEVMAFEIRYDKKTEKLFYSAFQDMGLEP